jgi:CRP/FNR family transcriptional regulator
MFVTKASSTSGGGYKCDLPLARAEIADFLGLTVETVSRNMTKLRASGIIQLDNGRTVTVNSLPLLKKASGD